MTVRIVRLGTPRAADEGLRIGTVRRPPRGVPAARFGPDDWYDVWYPVLAPSVPTMKLAQAATTEREWAAFRAAVPRRDGRARREPNARPARGALADHELLGRVLLRGRGALPPLGAARAARRSRRPGRVATSPNQWLHICRLRLPRRNESRRPERSGCRSCRPRVKR